MLAIRPAQALESTSAVAPAPLADFGAEPASTDARYAAASVMTSADNKGLPFVIVDKKNAKIFVFDAAGRLRGASAALLGLATGDRSAPGIGRRPVADIPLAERTTPAGRFPSQPGRNLQGEEVIWVNYSEGLAIHRLRPGNNQEQRRERLASSTPQDNRISLGCVVVPVAFYEKVVSPLLGKSRSVVYVLPEDSGVQALFDALSL
ncbi:MAG: L,D-transpeptidase [Polaromonas sp.]|nr:L,D-transpeptidase [Polaromonas sp.]